MYHGCATELKLQSDQRRPCLFYVFSDALVTVQPPLTSVTTSSNEANNVRAMAMVHYSALGLIGESPDISSSSFAFSTGCIKDAAGNAVYTEAFPVDDMSAHVSKKGWFGARIVITIKGKTPLYLVAGKQEVDEFATLLAKSLGSRLTGTVLGK